MFGVTNYMRQALLAALLLSPSIGWSEVRAALDPSTGAVNVTGLTAEDRAHLTEEPEGVFLQSSAISGNRSMALTASDVAGTLVITPKYSLLPDVEYDLRLDLDSGEAFEAAISSEGAKADPPQLLWHAPQAAVIPENTLRMYLMFSEPMAKGYVRDSIRLERSDSTIVDSPFLNLSAELWDKDQRRLTILFDPGRIKQGVGPNQSDGAPLQAGRRYVLVVSAQMQSAKGQPLNREVRVLLQVGAAQRSAIDPLQWKIHPPRIGTRETLRVQFDRMMDQASSINQLKVSNADGTPLAGNIHTDGSEWHFTPALLWTGNEQLQVDPRLEDVAGNTPNAPFDAPKGTIGKAAERILMAIFERP